MWCSSNIIKYSFLYTKIENEIANFDGFEYYQYYNTGSDAYPKTGHVFPLELLSTSSAEVLRWLGSDVENNQYYGGILSASLYDDNNNKIGYIILYQILLKKIVVMIII